MSHTVCALDLTLALQRTNHTHPCKPLRNLFGPLLHYPGSPIGDGINLPDLPACHFGSPPEAISSHRLPPFSAILQSAHAGLAWS